MWSASNTRPDAHGGDIRVFPMHEHAPAPPIRASSPTSDSDESSPSEVSPEPPVRAVSTIISRPAIQTWVPTPEAFLTRARARLARTGLHLDVFRRHEILELIFSELPTGDDFRTQAVMLERLESRTTASGAEPEHTTLRRYLWALYQSWVFDIDPADRNLDHLERGLRLKAEYRDSDRLRLRLEQSLVYKVYELLPETDADARARVCSLLEVDDERAKQLLERVEDYRRSQQQRGRG